MSRVFQVVRGICHYDATRIYPDVASVPDGIYSADVIFIDAPDYVREGWGYDGENFIEPIPPEGWCMIVKRERSTRIPITFRPSKWKPRSTICWRRWK